MIQSATTVIYTTLQAHNKFLFLFLVLQKFNPTEFFEDTLIETE